MKRVLLIGLGRWGVNHLRVLKSLPIELFVSDRDKKRLQASGVAESHQSDDARSLFSQIDAAVVVTPVQTHFDLCRELLQMGKDVFVEKPVSLESNKASELAELAQKNNLILQVGYIFRFDPASIWLRDAISARKFGKLKMLRARFSGFKRPRQDTGVTFADSIHFIDLFNFLLGTMPRQIHAVQRDFFGRGMDDESHIAMEYPAGGSESILATIESGYHAPGKFREITVIGTDSSAVCDFNVAQYKIKTYENRHVVETGEIKALEGAMRQLEFPPEEPLRAELAAFIESIVQRTAPLVDGWSGFRAVQVAEAALESARSGKWVELDK